MENNELAEIEASLQMLVRRAYDMGRNDALKKVVNVLNADSPGSDQLALMAPNVEAPEPEHENFDNMEPEPVKGPKPWWAWPVR